jgi:nitroreductase
MEVGHAIGNVCLQAISLGLGSVVIGAFTDTEMKHAMKLDKDEQPLLLLPVGKHKDF